MSTGNFHCIQHTIPAGHIRHYPRSTAHTQEEELSLAVKQYKPRHYEPQPGDVTILACHANGFPKELYEPLWDALYGYSGRERAGFRIRGIWIADAANQGDSGVLNDGKLGNERESLAVASITKSKLTVRSVMARHSKRLPRPRQPLPQRDAAADRGDRT